MRRLGGQPDSYLHTGAGWHGGPVRARVPWRVRGLVGRRGYNAAARDANVRPYSDASNCCHPHPNAPTVTNADSGRRTPGGASAHPES